MRNVWHSFCSAVLTANGLFLFLYSFFFPLSTSPANSSTSPMDQPFKSSTGLFTSSSIKRRRHGLWWYQVSFSSFEISLAHTSQSFNRNFWRLGREWLSPIRNLLVGLVSWRQFHIPDCLFSQIESWDSYVVQTFPSDYPPNYSTPEKCRYFWRRFCCEQVSGFVGKYFPMWLKLAVVTVLSS